jgi:hypothetical protein
LTNEFDQFNEAPVSCIASLDRQFCILRWSAVETIGHLLDGPAFAIERAFDQLFGNSGEFFDAIRFAAVGNHAQRRLELLLFWLSARISALAFYKNHSAQSLTFCSY